jgi:hypothetical protein
LNFYERKLIEETAAAEQCLATLREVGHEADERLDGGPIELANLNLNWVQIDRKRGLAAALRG